MNGAAQEEALSLIQACLATLNIPPNLLWELSTPAAHKNLPLGVQLKINTYLPFLPELIRSCSLQLKPSPPNNGTEQGLLASLYFTTTPKPGPRVQIKRRLACPADSGAPQGATPALVNNPPLQAQLERHSTQSDQAPSSDADDAHNQLVASLVAELEAAEAHVAQIKTRLAQLTRHCDHHSTPSSVLV